MTNPQPSQSDLEHSPWRGDIDRPLKALLCALNGAGENLHRRTTLALVSELGLSPEVSPVGIPSHVMCAVDRLVEALEDLEGPERTGATRWVVTKLVGAGAALEPAP